jgi:hypothetical protein
MKLRSTLLLLVPMLLSASLAEAATADPAATSPVVASPLCLANTSQAKLPTGNPVVLKTAQLCGACSDIRCANNTLGNTCASGGYTCQNVYGNFCSQDGLSQCTCTNRPPF